MLIILQSELMTSWNLQGNPRIFLLICGKILAFTIAINLLGFKLFFLMDVTGILVAKAIKEVIF